MKIIKLKKFTEADYDCYGGVDTDADYFPDAFINWEVPILHFASKTAVVIMDTSGISIDVYYDDKMVDDALEGTCICWHKEMTLEKSIQWLSKTHLPLTASDLMKDGFIQSI